MRITDTQREILLAISTRGFGLVAGLVTSVITARALGVEGRGIYFAIVTVTMLVLQIASLGLSSSNIYYISKSEKNAPKFTGNSFWVSLIVGGVVSAIAVLIYIFVPGKTPLPRSLLVFIPAISVVQLYYLFSSNILVGLNKINDFNRTQILFYSVTTVLFLYMFMIGGGVESFLLASVIASLAAIAFVIQKLKFSLTAMTTFHWPEFKHSIAYALRAYLTTLMGFLVLRGSVFFLQFMAPLEELGFYSIAAQMGEAMAVIPQAIALVLFPKLTRLGNDQYLTLYRNTGYTAAVMGLICGAVYLLAPLIVGFLYGSEFLPAAEALRMIVIGIFFLSMINIISQHLAADGFPWSIIIAWIVGLLFVVMISFMLIPDEGAMGASKALSAGYMLIFVILFVLARKRLLSVATGQHKDGFMNSYVLSNHPLTKEYLSRLESAFGSHLELIEVKQLRALSLPGMIKKLRRTRGASLMIALEDPSARALLSPLIIVACLTKVKGLAIADHNCQLTKFSRLHFISEAVKLVIASVFGQLAIIAAYSRLKRLVTKSRITKGPRDSANTVLYLNANLWFGIKAGGSVGHISGVANGLMSLGKSLIYASGGGPLLIREKAKFVELKPPGVFALPLETNSFRFSRNIVRQLQNPLRWSDIEFIYQRLSISDHSGVALSRAHRVPLVVEYNGSEVWIARNWGNALKYERASALAEDATLKHAHLIVTISEALRDELIERGIRAERIVTYPNCIDPEMFHPERFSVDETNMLRSELGLDPENIIATFIGTFGQWHGVVELARTIKLLCTKHGDWLAESKLHFLLIGDGLLMSEVKDILSEPACAGHYTLTGLIPQTKAPLHLAASDILLSPHVPNADGSKFFGSPTKLFEYMAMGKAIVASDLDQIGVVLKNSLRMPVSKASSSEIRESGKLSVLVEPGDIDELASAIRFATDNPEVAHALGVNAAREALLKYTWQHHVKAILEGLDRIK